MTKPQQDQIIIQAALDAFKELPVVGMSSFQKRKEAISDYSWDYEFDRWLNGYYENIYL